MAQLLCPYSGVPFLDGNGDPYVGAQLFVYEAGTSTKYTVTQDQAGASNHANPIILNSSGMVANGAGAAQAMWQEAGQEIKLVLAPSTDTDPPVAAIRTYDNIPGINDGTDIISQWVLGGTPTYIDATNFSVVGDLTSTYHVGRRIKVNVTAGVLYGIITETAYTTLTTVTVFLEDSGSLDSGLDTVWYSLLSVTNHSIPNVLIPYQTGPDLLENVSISATVASAALTIALKQKDGTDPTSGTPSRIAFRSETITDGDFDIVEVTSALSVVAPQGATLGYAGAAVATIYVYLINNAGTAELAIRSASRIDEGNLHSTTAIGTGSDLSSTLYSTTLRSSLPVRYLGRITVTMGASAGDWDNAPTQVNLGEVNNEQGAEVLPTNHIEGLELSIGTDTEHDIDISTGYVIDTTTTSKMEIATTLTKQIDATWAVGTDAGGMATTTTETGTFTSSGTAVTGSGSAFTTDFSEGDILYSSSNSEGRRIITIGSDTSITLESAFTADVAIAENVQKNGLAPNTVYYLHAVEADADDGIDAYYDVSKTAANIITGYTEYAPLGFVRTNSTSNIDNGDIHNYPYIPLGRTKGWVPLRTFTLSSSGTADLFFDNSLYTMVRYTFIDVDLSATDAFNARISTDGTSFSSSGVHFTLANGWFDNAGTSTTINYGSNGTGTSFELTGGTALSATESKINGELLIINPATTVDPSIQFTLTGHGWNNTTDDPFRLEGMGFYNGSVSVQGVRIFPASGNMTSGTIIVEGLMT